MVASIYIISKRWLQSLIVSIYMLYRAVLSESQLKERNKFRSSMTFPRALSSRNLVESRLVIHEISEVRCYPKNYLLMTSSYVYNHKNLIIFTQSKITEPKNFHPKLGVLRAPSQKSSPKALSTMSAKLTVSRRHPLFTTTVSWTISDACSSGSGRIQMPSRDGRSPWSLLYFRYRLNVRLPTCVEVQDVSCLPRLSYSISLRLIS